MNVGMNTIMKTIRWSVKIFFLFVLFNYFLNLFIIIIIFFGANCHILLV